MRAPGEGTADIGANRPGFRTSSRSIVEISPADIVRRRLANWGAIQGDRVTFTRPETFEYGFQAPRHLLIAYERGEREDGETLIEDCQNRLCGSSIASSASCLLDTGSMDGRHHGC